MQRASLFPCARNARARRSVKSARFGSSSTSNVECPDRQRLPSCFFLPVIHNRRLHPLSDFATLSGLPDYSFPPPRSGWPRPGKTRATPRAQLPISFVSPGDFAKKKKKKKKTKISPNHSQRQFPPPPPPQSLCLRIICVTWACILNVLSCPRPGKTITLSQRSANTRPPRIERASNCKGLSRSLIFW